MKLTSFTWLAALTINSYVIAADPILERQLANIADARTQHDNEVAAAAAAYEEAVKRAKNKLSDTYESAIAICMKRGGGESLDIANGLNAEKKLVFAELAPGKGSDGEAGIFDPALDALIVQLNGKKWYWHWEKPSRERPFIFRFDSGGTSPKLAEDGSVGLKEEYWKIERKWIVTDGRHVLFPVDPNRLRGVFVASGRSVCMFSDGK